MPTISQLSAVQQKKRTIKNALTVRRPLGLPNQGTPVKVDPASFLPNDEGAEQHRLIRRVLALLHHPLLFPCSACIYRCITYARVYILRVRRVCICVLHAAGSPSLSLPRHSHSRSSRRSISLLPLLLLHARVACVCERACEIPGAWLLLYVCVCVGAMAGIAFVHGIWEKYGYGDDAW